MWRQRSLHRPRGELRRRPQPSSPYTPTRVDEFRINEFAAAENLALAYRRLESEGGPAPGVDGITYADLSRSEMYDAVRAVSRAIRGQTYRPQPTRLVLIPKGDGRFRELQLPTIIDRVVARALLDAVGPHLAPRLPALGRSPWHVLLQIERGIREREWFQFTSADIRNCYPSLRIDDVLAAHRQYIDNPDLLWLIETVVRGHEGPDKLVGLSMGSPYSPIAAELMLQDCLALPYETADRGHPLLLRYVDDVSILSKSAPTGRRALERVRNALATRGLSTTSTGAVDLRRGERPTALGYQISWKQGAPQFHLPGEAFERLQQALVQAQLSATPHRSAMQIVNGWLLAAGPALSDRNVSRIVGRVRETCTGTGLQEIPTSWFHHEARKASDRWNSFRSTYCRSNPVLTPTASYLWGRNDPTPENR